MCHEGHRTGGLPVRMKGLTVAEGLCGADAEHHPPIASLELMLPLGGKAMCELAGASGHSSGLWRGLMAWRALFM